MIRPQYQTHHWGKSIRLTPKGFDEEVVLAYMTEPFVYSSVHLHELKSNKIVCNAGAVQIDTFPWLLTPEDLMRRSVVDSSYNSVLLLPGDHIEIEPGTLHRISSVSDQLTVITEVYLSDIDGAAPFHDDIVRHIPGGQKYKFSKEIC